MQSEIRIGVFDSGLGGLTILKHLNEKLTGCHLIYLGDTARLPYGSKSKKTVERYALQAATFLVEKKIDALIIACNTASAMGLELLKGSFNIPVFGVIEAGAQAALQANAKKDILVLATRATVSSEAYPKIFSSLAPHVKVHQIACPLLVPLAEEGWSEHKLTPQIISEYLQGIDLNLFDTVVLGCTHYPLLTEAFRKVLGPSIQLVHGGPWLANELKEKLKLGSQDNTVDLYLTDSPANLGNFEKLFPNLAFQQVDLLSF